MAVTRESTTERTDDDHPDFAQYLPATAGLSAEPGPVERVLTTVFRRRGAVPLFVRRRGR